VFLNACVSWIDLVGGYQWKGDLAEQAGVSLVIIIVDQFHEYPAVFFSDDSSVFRGNLQERVPWHYAVVWYGIGSDSEGEGLVVVHGGLLGDLDDEGLNLLLFDVDAGLVELDPVVEALTPYAGLFQEAWFLAVCLVRLLSCFEVAVFLAEVSLFTRGEVGDREKIVAGLTEAHFLIFVFVQVANTTLILSRSSAIPVDGNY